MCIIPGNNKLQEKSTAAETSSTENEELLLKLEEKTEEIEKKSSLIAKLEHDIKELLESKEKLQNECQITKENLKQDFDDQIECLREAVEEKERELFRAQEENVNTLRAELDRERDSVTKLTEERNSLQNDLNFAFDELKIIRDHLQAKSSEVLTLENKVNETNQAMDRLKQENEIVIEELQENISILKTEFGKLVEENQSLKTISETYQVQLQELKDHNLVTETQKEMVMSNMDVPSSEVIRNFKQSLPRIDFLNRFFFILRSEHFSKYQVMIYYMNGHYDLNLTLPVLVVQ